MSNPPIRAAIIGGGMIAAVHRQAILSAGAALAGVLGSTPTRSDELARRWGTVGFASLDELLSARIDVVHVCTPNATHVDFAAAALRAGVHVVCEKPIATTVDDAEHMVALAHENDLIAAVPFVYRYHPIVRELRARTRSGHFGRWFAVHGSYLQDWMLNPTTGNWRVQASTGGGSRAFADIGSHWCDLVEFVTGEAFDSVSAMTSIAVPRRPAGSTDSFATDRTLSAGGWTQVTTEDVAAVLLRTATGVPGSVVVSQVAGGRRNRLWFELDGEKGSAVFDQENAETAWLGTPDAATTIARGTGVASADQARLNFLPGGHAQGYQDCFNAFVTDTYAAIQGAVPDGLPTFADGLRSTRITDAVLRSAASGRWTVIDAAAPLTEQEQASSNGLPTGEGARS